MEYINNDVEEIIKVLNSNAEKKIDEYPNFHVGEFVESPNQCGCFKRNSKWYIYSNDERNFSTFTGPFSLNGVIYACAKLLHNTQNLKQYRFSEKELDVYINNNFHTFFEIDKYN